MARKRKESTESINPNPNLNLEEPTMSDNTAIETVETEVSTETEINGEATATAKRARKLEKDLSTQPGKVIITVLDGTKGAMVFDPADLTSNIREKLVPFGLGHKLGDAAAGKTGTDAEDAIEKVWEGLKADDWSVRAPAAPKVSLKDVAANFQNLTDEEKEAAKALMSSLGINIPGLV